MKYAGECSCLHRFMIRILPGFTGSRLNFSDPSEDDLRKLAEYCDPATFGRDSEAVLDEAYRKAGKLDIEHFSTFFDPTLCGLISQLEYLLLEGHDDSVGLRSELYKLNVYGESKIAWYPQPCINYT